MAHMKQILAVSLACVATGSAFAPGMHLPRCIARSTASKGIRMQVQLDEDVVAARRESTKTILRVPWTTEQPASKEAGSVSEAASVAPATPVAAVDPSADELKELDGTVKTSQASSATQAKERLLSEQRKSPSPVQSKPKALPQNEFVTMALKAGALKQSSPLVMSEMAGNKGFDPLGFAKDKGLLLQYREAELKHARLAMLASVGWVMSELWHTPLAELLGAENLLQEDKAEFLAKAPSVLNGGLQNVPVFFWISTLLLTGAIEGWRMLSINEQGPLKFTPGQLGFDPLGFYAQEGAKGRMDLQTKELNNGRLAMLAIAFFAASEFATNAAVVDQTPGLFTEGPLANAGNLGGLLGEYSGLLSCKSGLVYCTEGQDSFTAMMSNEASNAEYINEIMGE